MLKDPVPCPNTNDVRASAVFRAIELMTTDLNAKITLAVLARAGHFSPFHFHRVFRDVTGVTPARFLAALRMAEAKRLLLHSRISVVDVSVQVGYDSPGTFSTQFTQLVGVAPGRFRHLVQRFAGESMQALLSVVPPRRDDEDAMARRCGTRITLEGSASVEAIVVGGLFAEGSVRGAADAWIVASGQVPFCAATVPDAGEYRACAVVVDPRSQLSDILVDQAPESYLSGVVHVRAAATGASAQEPMNVVLHPPKLTDPPLLAVTPLSWLDDQTPDGPRAGPAGGRRVHGCARGDRHARSGPARNPTGTGPDHSRTVTVALASTA
jgi:AraC family transcriptional regulator